MVKRPSHYTSLQKLQEELHSNREDPRTTADPALRYRREEIASLTTLPAGRVVRGVYAAIRGTVLQSLAADMEALIPSFQPLPPVQMAARIISQREVATIQRLATADPEIIDRRIMDIALSAGSGTHLSNLRLAKTLFRAQSPFNNTDDERRYLTFYLQEHERGEDKTSPAPAHVTARQLSHEALMSLLPEHLRGIDTNALRHDSGLGRPKITVALGTIEPAAAPADLAMGTTIGQLSDRYTGEGIILERPVIYTAFDMPSA